MNLNLTCINCRVAFTYKASCKVEAECLASVGACCDSCCKIAEEYFESDDYLTFEESEA